MINHIFNAFVMYEIQKLTAGLKSNFNKYVIQESIERIYYCLEVLEEGEVWQSPNAQCNSAGHLILHLCGNARQYIISALGNMPDIRARPEEFTTMQHLSKEGLKQKLSQLAKEMWMVVDGLHSTRLMEQHRVQCFDMTTLDIIIHVIEHFTYHTGQIVYMTKALKDIDTGFYKDMPLG